MVGFRGINVAFKRVRSIAFIQNSLNFFLFLHYLLNSFVYYSRVIVFDATIVNLISEVINVLLSFYCVKIFPVFAEPDDWAYVQQTGRPHWISAGLFVARAERRDRFSDMEKVPRPTEDTPASDSLFIKRT